MEKILQKIPFLRLTFVLSSGIVTGSLVTLPFVFVILFTSLLFLMVTAINLRYRFYHAATFGTGIHLILFLTGYMLNQQFNRKPVFYNGGKYMAVILEYPTVKQSTLQTKIEIYAFLRDSAIMNTKEVVSASFINLTDSVELIPGETIIFSAKPEMITNRGNPYEFDYQRYMMRNKIFRQVYLSDNEWIKGEMSFHRRILVRSEKIRHKLLEIYRTKNISDKQFMILSALTLGYKKELDQETKDTFAATGATHVLAVSGLHVGIIYIFLSILLSPLRRVKTAGILYTTIIICILWLYALITGLSPSVCRSAAMFTFLITGKSLRRSIGVYNSLAASAFFLLIFNPNNLFNAGFQLSYTAVWSIVTLQPHFQKILVSKNQVFRYFWSLITVSAAAQTGTLPLTLFYFNLFPTYFLISGIYIIPAVTLLIPSGLMLLLFSRIGVISQALVFLINKTLGGTIFLLERIQKLPGAVYQPEINTTQSLVLIFMVMLLARVLKTKKIHHFSWLLASVLLFSAVGAGTKIRDRYREEIIVYNLTGPVIIHLINGKRNYIITERLPANGSYAWKTIQTVVRKKHLDEPVFMDIKNNSGEPGLLMKDGMIHFGDKLILTNQKLDDLPGGIYPDIVIDPLMDGKDVSGIFNNAVIVLSKRSDLQKLQNAIKIYHLKTDGAFYKKW